MTEAPASSAPTDGARLSRRGVERLDLLLLTIEALDLNGGEAMVWTSQQMGLSRLMVFLQKLPEKVGHMDMFFNRRDYIRGAQ